MIIGREPIECRRDGVKFHVRSGPHKLVRVLLVDNLIRVERDNLDCEESWFERRLMYNLVNSRSQLEECRRRVSHWRDRARSGGWRRRGGRIRLNLSLRAHMTWRHR